MCSESWPTENIYLLQDLMHLYHDIFEEEYSYELRKNEKETTNHTPSQYT